jgi:uncharacterized protein
MFQSWRDLLFAHWPVPAETLRPLVPPELILEEFDGSAWVSLTPFLLSGLRLRLTPPLPGISEFPEMNFRTYVRVGDRSGIYFFSLDAGNALAVAGARAGYRLPYFRADMRIERHGEWVRYHSRRRDPSGATFTARYRPTGPPSFARTGTLDAFLSERYALFTVLRSGTVLCGEIHHPPWSLQPAEVEIERNSVPRSFGLELSEHPVRVRYSRRQDTLIWLPMPA